MSVIKRLLIALVIVLITVHTASALTALGLTEAGSRGIFDPSVANGAGVYMSYSSVDPSASYSQNGGVVSTRLAHSTNGGTTWTDDGLINAVTEKSPNIDWINEVSSLVYDPTDSGAAAWKLFWHHYPVVNGSTFPQNGWIGYKSASTALGLLSASEVKLMAGGAYDTANNTLNGTSGSPVGGAPSIMIGDINAVLSMPNGCAAITEPGVLANSSGIYMAITCIYNLGAQQRIDLLKCAAPCSAPGTLSSWTYLGNLLDAPDATFFGGNFYSGGDLAQDANGNAFLVASILTNTPFAGSYNGCDVFHFTKLDTATLEMNSGHPKRIKSVSGTAGTFNGACSLQRTVPQAGFIFGQLDTSGSFPLFHLYVTGPSQALPPPITSTHTHSAGMAQ